MDTGLRTFEVVVSCGDRQVDERVWAHTFNFDAEWVRFQVSEQGRHRVVAIYRRDAVIRVADPAALVAAE